MNPIIAIRNEAPGDVGAIAEVTIAAFESLEISGHTEQFIVEALRAARALTVSLVAEVDGRVGAPEGHEGAGMLPRGPSGLLPEVRVHEPARTGLAGVPPEVFCALSFDGQAPQGHVAFHEAFRADGRLPKR